jgi:peptide/nickel transport system substrate-binding protein
VFHPTGTYGTKHPVGTGPFTFGSWTVGNRLVIVKNKKYWGAKAHLDRVIFRPISDNAARLQALQSGEIQGYDLVDPADISTIKKNSGLKLLSRPAFNVGYVGINQAIPPMNKLAVRQALAYGLDRKTVVNGFYAGRGVVANQFLPNQVVGFANSGVPSYPYNPDKAKSLLKAAGLDLPVPITFWYPTNVSRPYMPNAQQNAQVFGASLEKSGFKVTFKSEPWRPDYLGDVQGAGVAQVYLLGWTGDFGDPANFLNVHFGQFNKQFGFNNKALFSLLQKADGETNLAKRKALYQQASIMVMKFLPMVPYVHSSPALAFRKNVNGYKPSPVSLEPFSTVYLGT